MAIDNTRHPPCDTELPAISDIQFQSSSRYPLSWVAGKSEAATGSTQPPSATSDQPPASRLLSRAASNVLGQRERQHGDRQASFRGIAAMWNAYLDNRKQPDAPIAAYDVAWMMVLLKQQRAAWGDGMLQDHYLDAAAYAAIAWELAAIIAKPESDD